MWFPLYHSLFLQRQRRPTLPPELWEVWCQICRALRVTTSLMGRSKPLAKCSKSTPNLMLPLQLKKYWVAELKGTGERCQWADVRCSRMCIDWMNHQTKFNDDSVCCNAEVSYTCGIFCYVMLTLYRCQHLYLFLMLPVFRGCLYFCFSESVENVIYYKMDEQGVLQQMVWSTHRSDLTIMKSVRNFMKRFHRNCGNISKILTRGKFYCSVVALSHLSVLSCVSLKFQLSFRCFF